LQSKAVYLNIQKHLVAAK